MTCLNAARPQQAGLVTVATGATQLLLHGIRQSMDGMSDAPSSEPVSSSKGDTGRKWLPEVCSSSMVSYLKLFLAFLMLRRRFVNATLYSKARCQSAVEGCSYRNGAHDRSYTHPDENAYDKAYSNRTAQAGHCSAILLKQPAAASANAA